MRNNFFYILIICAFTEIFMKNVENKATRKEKVTREYLEVEAKKDIESLLSSLKNSNFSEEDDYNTEALQVNAPRSHKIMQRIDEVLKGSKSKKFKQKAISSNAPMNAAHIKRGAYTNAVKSNSKYHYTDANNKEFLQLINRLAPFTSAPVKNRISGGHNAKYSLRQHVNYVNIKPEVFPIFETEDKFSSREIASKEDLRVSEQYYANEDDALTFKLLNEVDTKHKNGNYIRHASVPVSDNVNLYGLLNQLYIKRDEGIPTKKEHNDDAMLNEFSKNDYSQSTNNLGPGYRPAHNVLKQLQDNIDSENIDNTNTIILRSDLIHEMNPHSNERYAFWNNSDFNKNLRSFHDTLPYGNRAARQGSSSRNRRKRSLSTQAGYTQDPDTCKTYNENLVKLWSNLSKLINATDQPNERALHNIAMIIQAYLEHQNAKPLPEAKTHKAKHEGRRDKISEIMRKIRRMLDAAQGSSERITKIIIKYLKPNYTDVKSEDCQEVNEAFLGLSVDLLFKNYLENVDCEGEDDDIARNNRVSVREKKVKKGKPKNGDITLSLATSDLKPKFHTILIKDELYNNFQKAKMPRQRPTNKYKRVFKPNKKQRSRPVNRSGYTKELEKLKKRSEVLRKSVIKKFKNRSLKTNLVRGRCEKSASRKLTVSLRPVMERFIGLLECQLDNTLRSVNFGSDSRNLNYLYSQRHRNISPMLLVKNTVRKRNKSSESLHRERHYSSVENNKNIRVRDDETDSTWVKKYSFDPIKGMKFETRARHKDARVSNKNIDPGDYLINYNEYFQSPPLYDDYEGIYKTHQVSNINGFPSLINPLISLNDKKNTRDKSSYKKLATSNIEPDSENENSDYYDTFYDENSSEETTDMLNYEQERESSIVEIPFTDLTKLSNEHQLIDEKSKTHVKSYESITDFLKRARDESLRTPEFAVPFALDTNKGYVELTHLIKYPQSLVYRPQFLVKNTMPYDDFLKTINKINMTNDEIRLMKIVRHLPDGTVQFFLKPTTLKHH